MNFKTALCFCVQFLRSHVKFFGNTILDMSESEPMQADILDLNADDAEMEDELLNGSGKCWIFFLAMFVEHNVAHVF